MPALSSALAYFDLSRTARSTADLTQAQRDFFGAHGFERIGAPGVVAHGPWAMSAGEWITERVGRGDGATAGAAGRDRTTRRM